MIVNHQVWGNMAAAGGGQKPMAKRTLTILEREDAQVRRLAIRALRLLGSTIFTGNRLLPGEQQDERRALMKAAGKTQGLLPPSQRKRDAAAGRKA